MKISLCWPEDSEFKIQKEKGENCHLKKYY